MFQPNALPINVPVGYAEDVRQGQAGEHLTDGLPSELVGNELHRHDGPDAEERSLCQARDHAAQEENGVVARRGGDEITCDEQGHQANKYRALLETREPKGQYRSPEDDGQGVSGDQAAGPTFGDPERVGHLGQDAGNDEFGHADSEGRKCE